jgi:hypothetical protein
MARAMAVPLLPPHLRRPDLEAACDALARAAAPLLPLMRAAADGRLSLCILQTPDAPWPARTLGELRLPVVVLVGDDPGPHPEAALGPQGWKAAERLRRWCRWSMVHGAGGEPAHYAAAAEAAEAVRRVALVETSHLRAMSWRRFLGPAGLTILPPAGMVHPVRPVLQ